MPLIRNLFGKRSDKTARFIHYLNKRKALYSNDRLTNARARNAARAASNEATRKVWAARKEAILAAAGQARNAAVAVTKKIGSGLATGGLALAAAALVAANAAKRGAQYVGGKAYGAAGAAAGAAAAAAAAAAGKLRSLSALRRVKGAFLGTAKLSESEKSKLRAMGITNLNSTRARNEVKAIRSAAAGHLVRLGNKNAAAAPIGREGGLVGKMRSAARIVSEKAAAAAAATRKAVAAAGAAIKQGASNSWAFLGKKAGNAGSYLSRKAGNLKNSVNLMRYGSHEAALLAKRKRTNNKLNLASRNMSVRGRSQFTKANSSKGLLRRLGNGVKGFTRGLGERLGKLRGMFKGTKKNSMSKLSNMWESNTGPINTYGNPLKVSEGRSAGKNGARLGLFGAPRMSTSAAARRLRPNQYNSEGRFLSPRTQQAKAALAADQALLKE